MQDIKLRYRGSLLGPFWITLSTMIMVGRLGVGGNDLHVSKRFAVNRLSTGQRRCDRRSFRYSVSSRHPGTSSWW